MTQITQQEIVQALGVKPAINGFNETNRRIKFLKEKLVTSNANGFVLGLSGGADSALAGWMAKQAVTELTKETGKEYTLHTLALPFGIQQDANDVREIAENYVNPDKHFTIDISASANAVVREHNNGTGEQAVDFNKGNVKSRLRMVQLYLHAATYGLLVLGTDNAAEQLTGFFTKFGDGAYDVNPLQTLTKKQVMMLLLHTKAPSFLQDKQPMADLLEGKPELTDEEALGVTYQDIDAFLSGMMIADEAKEIIISLYTKTMHKRDKPYGI